MMSVAPGRHTAQGRSRVVAFVNKSITKATTTPLLFATKRHLVAWDGPVFRILLSLANLSPTTEWRALTGNSVERVSDLRRGILLEEGPALFGSAAPLFAADDTQVRRPASRTPRAVFPAVMWREFRSAQLRGARRTGFVVENELAIEQSEWSVFHGSNYKHAMNFHHVSGQHALASTLPDERHVDAAIYAGSFAPDNWYHWLIETLPRLWLATQLPEQFAQTPVLVPVPALEIESMRVLLESVIGRKQVLPLHVNETVRVDRLVWIDGLFTAKHHVVYPDGGFDHSSAFHALGMHLFRSALQAKPATPGRVSFPDRVFLDRDRQKRPYNRKAIMRIAEAAGFVGIDPSMLTVWEQFKLFQSAHYVVGPTGGAWANVFMAHEGLRGLYWCPDDLVSSETWPTLAAFSGAKVFAIGYPQAVHEFHRGEYTLDPLRFTSALEQLLEGERAERSMH